MLHGQRPRKLVAVSPLVAETIILAVAVALAVAVIAYITGFLGSASQVEIYQPYILTLGGPGDTAWLPIPGYALVEAWSNATSGGYRVYLRVTAVKHLDYIHVKAEVRVAGGGLPSHASGAAVEWEDTNVPPGWYSERYWEPILPEEYPVTIRVHVWIRVRSG